jgi:hypothetical protein
MHEKRRHITPMFHRNFLATHTELSFRHTLT